MAIPKTAGQNLFPILDFTKKSSAGKTDPKRLQQAINQAADFAAGQKEFQKAAPGLGLGPQEQQKIIQAAGGNKAKLAESVGQLGAPPAGGGAAPAGGGAGAAPAGGGAPASKGAAAPAGGGACANGRCNLGGGSAAGRASGGSCANGRCNGASGQGGNALGGSCGCPNGNCGGSGQGIPTEKFIEAKDLLTKNGGKMDATMEGTLRAKGLPDNFINYFKQPHVQSEMENANKEAVKAEEARKADIAKQVATARESGKAEGVKEATEAAKANEGSFEKWGKGLDGFFKGSGSDAKPKVEASDASSKAGSESKTLGEQIGGFVDKAVDTVKAAGETISNGANDLYNNLLGDNSQSDTGNLASAPSAEEPGAMLASSDPAPAAEPAATPEPVAAPEPEPAMV